MRRPAASVVACAAIAVAVLGLEPPAPALGSDEKPRILIVTVDHTESSDRPDYYGRLIEALVNHFEATVERVSAEEYVEGETTGFDRLIVVGVNPAITLPTAFVEDAARFRLPTMWIGYGLDQLPVDYERQFGFAVGYARGPRTRVHVEYRRRSIPAVLSGVHYVSVSGRGVKELARVAIDDGVTPYILRAAQFWFVNGLPATSGDYPTTDDAPFLVLADALHPFIGQAHEDRFSAVIRLEDISAHVPADRLRPAVEYLAGANVPYVIAVIPAQRLPDGTLLRLENNPSLVALLRWAQDHGATVTLHGYHHTFGSGEDYEFWDEERNAPLLGETWGMYATKVEDGIRILRDLGLRPLLWETPHYLGSGLAYQVFDQYFGVSIENRAPVSWLPYPSTRDDHTLISENLGYIAPAAPPSSALRVDDQIDRARLLKLVRDPWGVGFYHPVSVPVEDLISLVEGLRDLGYEFTDVRELRPRVSDPYEPGWLTGVRNALGVQRELLQLELGEHMATRFGWWSTAIHLPWFSLLLLGLGALLVIRLRGQWNNLESSGVGALVPGAARSRPRLSASLLVAGSFVAVSLLDTVGAAVSAPSANPHVVANGATTTGAAMPGDPVSKATAAAPPFFSGNWEVSTYYTAVEEFYSGARMTVEGCPFLECSAGTQHLGSFKADFVQAVIAEGSGRTASPDAKGRRYLNWSASTGFWRDYFPRDAQGFVLRPYQTVAAGTALAYGSSVHLQSCGEDKITGDAIGQAACSALTAANWEIRDRFETLVAPLRLDLYLGDQDRARFSAESPTSVHVVRVAAAVTPSRRDRD